MASSPSIVFDHVACGVRRLADIAPVLELELGADAHRGGPGAGFRGGQWAFAGGGRLELIEPDGEPGGFLHRFLERSGAGIHHVTFKVPRIEDARDRALALGYDVVGFNDRSPSWKECFLHPRQAGGIVVQMAEADPNAADDNWKDIARFTSGEPRRRVALLGLKMVSRDAAASRKCWVDLLGASVETATDAGRRVDTYRWPASPLRLRVVVDDTAGAEGPLGLEFADFGAGFPEGLSSLLGAPLLLA